MNLKFRMRSKVNTKEMMARTAGASHARIGLAAAQVERIAKKLVSKGGGRKKGGHVPSKPNEPPHVRTGNLMNSIKWEYIGRLAAIIGPSVLYGKLLEFGTRHMTERPYMRPALRMARASLPKFFGRLF